MNLKRFMPHYRVFEVPDGRISSMRCCGFGWDRFVSKSGDDLTQWGRGLPLHFICKFPVESGPPIYMLSEKWVKLRRRPGMIAGHTFKPLDVAKFWRKVNDTGRSQGLVRVLRRR